jgi:prophage regulatory protein
MPNLLHAPNGSITAARPTKYLRQTEVLDRVGVSWITLLRWERQNQFPKRRKLSPKTVAWVEAEVEEWCATRAARETGEIA